jgi:hypothetical protein
MHVPMMRRVARAVSVTTAGRVATVGVAAFLAACSAFIDFGSFSSGNVPDAARDGASDGAGGGRCGSRRVDFALAQLDSGQTVNLDFQDAGMAMVFGQTGVCPRDVGDSSVPVRVYVAQNQTDAPATLSAWTVCATSTESALIALYADASALPKGDALRTCATVVASGGANDYGSPDNHSSGYCPGLTKANGGGLLLAPCEEAVIYVQDNMIDPDAPAPSKLLVTLE